MANPLKILTNVTASAGLAVTGSDGLKVQQGGIVINGGDLRLNNNIIKSSDGSTAITLNSTDVKTGGDLIVGAGHIKVGTNTESIILDASTGRADFQGGVRVTGSTVTSGSLTVGGNGVLTAQAGLVATGSVTLDTAGSIKVGGATLLAKDTDNSTYTGSILTDAYGQGTAYVSVGVDAGGDYAELGAGQNGALSITSQRAVLLQGAGNQLAQVRIDGSTRELTLQGKDVTTIKTTTAGGTVAISGSTATSGSLTVGGNGTLTVNGSSTLTGDVTFGGNIVADANENKSIFAAVTSNTITVGAAGATVSIPGTASIGGNLTVTGDLTINGTTTTINSTTLTVDDKNIILGSVASPTDTTADGGGITLSGSTDKTFNWVNSTDSWTSSEHLDLASGKAFKLATKTVLETGSVTHPNLGASNAIIVSYNGKDQGSYLSVASSSGGPVEGTFVDISSSLQTLIRGEGIGGMVGGVTLEGGAGGVEIISAGTNDTSVSLYSAAGGIKLQTGDTTNGVVLSATNSTSGTVVQGILHVQDDNGAYTNFTVTKLDGQYTNITGALAAIDAAITNIAGATIITPEEYYNIRTVVKGVKQSGNDTVVFTISGSANDNQEGRTPSGKGLTSMSSSNADTLVSTLMAGMSFDIATKAPNTGLWTNDLVSVQLSASALQNGFYWPQITVDAPSLVDNSEIRLIVVNENNGVII